MQNALHLIDLDSINQFDELSEQEGRDKRNSMVSIGHIEYDYVLKSNWKLLEQFKQMKQQTLSNLIYFDILSSDKKRVIINKEL